jgi:hypothetical protein
LDQPAAFAVVLAAAFGAGIGAAWHPLAGAIVLLATLAVAVVPPLLARRSWGWQRVLISHAAYSRAQILSIVGAVTPGAANRWLAASADATPSDRYHVLAFVGRDEDAERLIPELPVDTIDEQFDRAWNEVGRDWRTTGVLDVTAMADLLPALTPAARTRGEIDIAVMRALDAAGAGRTLATLPPPPAAPLALRWSILVWWQRYWLVWRALFGFAVGATAAALIVR